MFYRVIRGEIVAAEARFPHFVPHADVRNLTNGLRTEVAIGVSYVHVLEVSGGESGELWIDAFRHHQAYEDIPESRAAALYAYGQHEPAYAISYSDALMRVCRDHA